MTDYKKKSFFDTFSPKAGYFMGLGSGLLIIIVVGFFILLSMILSDGGSSKQVKLSNNGNGSAAQPSGGALPAATNARGLYLSIADKVGLDEDDFTECIDSGKHRTTVLASYQTGIEAGVRGTPGSFVNGVALAGAVPYEEVKAAVDAALDGTAVTAEVEFDITEADHILGNPNAPVTIVEFSDFQCPFCSRFHPTLQQVLGEYPDDVRWVYRHFPLSSIHVSAQSAAEASECAAELGGNDAFWEFGDLLFQNQQLL